MKIQVSTASGHGGLRGSTAPKTSSSFQGKFGRMFRSLPPADFDDIDLEQLAGSGKIPDLPVAETPPSGIMAYPEVKRDGPKEDGVPLRVDGKLVPNPAPELDADSEENFGIPSGYTYLGQFIDHDITFDPASSMQKRNDPEALIDFRTPALDLDCLYGRGPDDQPYMYQSDGVKFILGAKMSRGGNPSSAKDLPRVADPNFANSPSRAIIGDKRNDENVIVSQLQGVFLNIHNAIADKLKNPTFEEVQRLVRWHYQWIVLYDFLPRIVNAKTYKDIFRHLANVPDDKVALGIETKKISATRNTSNSGMAPDLKFYKWRNDAFMPIEFAMAAYRFGHSMVRPIYRLSTELKSGGIVNDGRRAIFAGVQDNGLNGFNGFPSDWAIDWSLYFEIKDKIGFNANGEKTQVQPAYKIDPSMVNPLAFLPEFSDLPIDNDGNLTPKKDQLPNLALRNLLRGKSMDLPSGQDVAMAMGVQPLSNKELMIGKAAVGDVATNLTIQDLIEQAIKEGRQSSFEKGAPLWFYVLAESLSDWAKLVSARKLANPTVSDKELNAIPTRLGEVGGRIVMEVLVGLIQADPNSFLSQDPLWTPARAWDSGRDGILSSYIRNDRFGMAEMINAAGLS
jgi:hypothetical protein